ncbi:MAG TPA: twin-arginine translocase subunit TatC [Nitrososphaerales archaeon]|nr:twin-arginine translocase subunit TatC [Nitrososphaerales archaeon]
MSGPRQTFWEHINELRARLRVVAICVVVVLIILLLFPINPVYQFQHLSQYVNLQFVNGTATAWFLHQVDRNILPSGWKLIAAGGIGEGMEIYFIAGILLTIALCTPAIMYEVYKFVDPALKENERNLIYPFVTATSILFLVGLLFGYFVLAHFLVLFLAPFFNAVGISPQVDAAQIYYVIFLIIGATGISFTSPVFIYALISLKVIDPSFFSRNRVMIWFVIWIIAGLFLTPDGGPLLDMVLFLPLVALVEAAVFFGRRRTRGAGSFLFGSKAKPEPGPHCKYCSTEIPPGTSFCPSCGRANPL